MHQTQSSVRRRAGFSGHGSKVPRQDLSTVRTHFLPIKTTQSLTSQSLGDRQSDFSSSLPKAAAATAIGAEPAQSWSTLLHTLLSYYIVPGVDLQSVQTSTGVFSHCSCTCIVLQQPGFRVHHPDKTLRSCGECSVLTFSFGRCEQARIQIKSLRSSVQLNVCIFHIFVSYVTQ